MIQSDIFNLTHEQIPTYVEQQVVLGRNRVAVLREIAALRKDITLLSVREDQTTFQQKVKATLNSAQG